jgi:hypothetical protein
VFDVTNFRVVNLNADEMRILEGQGAAGDLSPNLCYAVTSPGYSPSPFYVINTKTGAGWLAAEGGGDDWMFSSDSRLVAWNAIEDAEPRVAVAEAGNPLALDDAEEALAGTAFVAFIDATTLLVKGAMIDGKYTSAAVELKTEGDRLEVASIEPVSVSDTGKYVNRQPRPGAAEWVVTPSDPAEYSYLYRLGDDEGANRPRVMDPTGQGRAVSVVHWFPDGEHFIASWEESKPFLAVCDTASGVCTAPDRNFWGSDPYTQYFCAPLTNESTWCHDMGGNSGPSVIVDVTGRVRNATAKAGFQLDVPTLLTETLVGDHPTGGG